MRDRYFTEERSYYSDSNLTLHPIVMTSNLFDSQSYLTVRNGAFFNFRKQTLTSQKKNRWDSPVVSRDPYKRKSNHVGETNQRN